MTEFLFRDDAYLQSATASVTAITADGGIVLDRTVFYATSGGQPGDNGQLVRADGSIIAIATAVHPDGDKTQIVHVPVEGASLPTLGEAVRVDIDWDRRHRLMRMHTALHLLSVVFPFPVTGGSIGEDKGRLDFDMPEVPEDLAALEAALNTMVEADHLVTTEWITDAEMEAQADLIKTMKVKRPPARVGSGWCASVMSICSPAAERMLPEQPRSVASRWARSKRRASRTAGSACSLPDPGP